MPQPSKRGPLSFEVLQEYLEALDHSGSPDTRHKELLTSYAELHFHAFGGGRCGMCNAHVRHMLPVSIRKGKETKRFEGLCQRCLEGERAQADSVEIRLGDASWELVRKHRVRAS